MQYARRTFCTVARLQLGRGFTPAGACLKSPHLARVVSGLRQLEHWQIVVNIAYAQVVDELFLTVIVLHTHFG